MIGESRYANSLQDRSSSNITATAASCRWQWSCGGCREYMVTTPAVRNLIREGKEHQLYSTIQTGHSYGMQTMDSALVKLYQSGKITKEVVLEYCIDHAEVQRMIRNWV